MPTLCFPIIAAGRNQDRDTVAPKKNFPVLHMPFEISDLALYAFIVNDGNFVPT